jgi:membrane-bound lytic murein transglycosylase D
MRIKRARKIAAFGLLFAPFFHSTAPGAEASDPFAHPPELEQDVRFWIRVYAEVTTDQGLLHDDWYLGLVYEVLRFDPAASPAQRERRVAEAKARYESLLKRFAAGSTDNLTPHEQRILHAFGVKATPRDFRDAIERIRFQLGQADRFHEGLIRAAVWERQIGRTLEQHGVPAEIAALPHVESSFNLTAYSKVGAAGLWQFMPSTAKRFMRVDGVVDERLDPYSATEAAANLMLYNYRLLGTWPLAVTAYNHGPGGLRRAQDELGTSDIAVIVKRYQGKTFGFASRNFYVAFLAALEVDRNAEKYFGPIIRLPDTDSTTVELPDYFPVGALAKAFKVDMGALRVLNPALRPPIWSGSRYVPRGYALRLPGTPPQAEIAAAWSRLPPAERYVAQRNDGSHRIRRKETLAGIAAASGVSMSRLLAANGWSADHAVSRGETVRIPQPASRAELAGGGTPAIAALAPEPAPAAAAQLSPGAPPAAAPTPASASSPAQVPAPASSPAPAQAQVPAPASSPAPAGPQVAASVSSPVHAPPLLLAPASPPAAVSAPYASVSAPPSATTPASRTASTPAPSSAIATTPAPRTASAPAASSGSATTSAPATASAPAPVTEKIAPPPKEPVSARQTDSNALLPVAAPTGNSDTTDYGVGDDDTVTVQAAETLGHYADWSGVSAQTLRTLNKLHKTAMVTLGHKVKLNLSRVTPAQFEATRREYHRQLQEDYFAAHRIAGTENYSVKRGESLWVIAQQHADLPVWLVTQYNPDVDFNDVRPGTTITLPRVVAINRE